MEEWRAIVGYEGLYEVSSLGRIRSLYFSPPRPSRQGVDSCGYPIIMLTKDGKRRPFTVHRLVCRAFHGEPYLIWNEAAHLDGDRGNCRANNLKWATKIENHFHRRAHGTHPQGEKHPRALLTDDLVRRIRVSRDSAQKLATELGVSYHTVADVRCGKRWTHVR